MANVKEIEHKDSQIVIIFQIQIKIRIQFFFQIRFWPFPANLQALLLTISSKARLGCLIASQILPKSVKSNFRNI